MTVTLTLTKRDRAKIQKFGACSVPNRSIKAITATGKHRVTAVTDDGTLTLDNGDTAHVRDVSLPALVDPDIRKLHHRFRASCQSAQSSGDYTDAIAAWQDAQALNLNTIELNQLIGTDVDFWQAIASGDFAIEPEPATEPAIAVSEPPTHPDAATYAGLLRAAPREPWYLAWLLDGLDTDLVAAIWHELGDAAAELQAIAAQYQPPDLDADLTEWLTILRHAATPNNPAGNWDICAVLSAIKNDPTITASRKQQLWAQLTPEHQNRLKSAQTTYIQTP